MAVTKRTRFEVLRRDNYTCQYCRSTDGELTIDHVIPIALGGTDEPSNLVACCRDCNAGKSSTSPDEAIVASVEEDAQRWSEAMRKSAEVMAAKAKETAALVEHWRHSIWESWSAPGGDALPLPDDWRVAIANQLAAGLTMNDLEHAVQIAMAKHGVRNGAVFRYFMGVCKNKLADRIAMARKILNDEVADVEE